MDGNGDTVMYRLKLISSENIQGLKRANGPCEGVNQAGIVCVAEVHLSPKPLSDPA